MDKKRSLLSLLLICFVFFASCNKKLKNELDELEMEMAVQEQQNALNQYQIQLLQDEILNLKEPKESIDFSFIGTPYAGRSCQLSGLYVFRGGPNTNYMQKNSDTDYYVYLERANFVYNGEQDVVSIHFNYNPIDQVVSNAVIENKGLSSGGMNNGFIRFKFDQNQAENQLNIDVRAFIVSGGYIEISLWGSSTTDYRGHFFEDYTNVSESYDFGVASFSASFEGRLEVFDRSGGAVQ